ncbi:MBL fold metallo-hydrolase [Sporanaerobacter acetigenes]|uniref:7,8-dihydropterin-6-yl-methyl-4-(Beta-D-ribofuranosyl)aminobenzene 5'-phosphate synthase n=1 Tax=Sporanaerobacter acetigenes DSM 13106 TaxID=1123281 RepID=A0A1M5WAA0_9FIRM|nr:MBL fold metallo-hydrolase [Sporanaerobacter acetigenes]SHH84425.1 7,8-dihydropterin-6-yl-methyl-4-(beta-D-ribofuranosyl)aminobenzene 5'-phosphate synthase [Sporanaerobacter acetigenes DSM 13106]
MKNKTYVAIVLVLALFIIQAIPAFASDNAKSNKTKLIVDGQEVDVNAFILDGTTYAPLRYMVEQFGGNVEYKDGKVYVNKGKTTEKKAPVKVTTLIENSNASHPELDNEFGISMYIETEDGNILFDTAKTGKFLENAKKLNIDMSKTDYMILSHEHYDHCGGVKPFYENVKPNNCTFCVKDSFFKYPGKYHYQEKPGPKLDFTDGTPGHTAIGIDFDEAYLKGKGVKIEYIDVDEYKLNDQITIFSNFDRNYEKLNTSMQVKTAEGYKTDEFVEEVAIAIDTNKGIVILTGCSHNGIMNIVDTIHRRTGKNIYAVIGRTHLIDADEARIEKTIQYFRDLGVEKVGVSHCTGPKAIEMFQRIAPDMSFVNSTGTVLEFK